MALRIALLASGAGTTAEAVLRACASGRIDGEVAVVIANNRDAGVFVRAAAHGVPTRHLSGRTHPDPSDLDLAVCATLAEFEIDVVALVGYMKQLGPRTLSAYAGRVLNTGWDCGRQRRRVVRRSAHLA